MRFLFFLLIIFFTGDAILAQKLDSLTVEKIMRDPKWIGSSPSSPQWSPNGEYLYFNWNPDKAPADSLYFISYTNKKPAKVSPRLTWELNNTGSYTYNKDRTYYLYTQDNDIFMGETKTGKIRRVTRTIDVETNPRFSFNETKLVYTRNQNIYAWDINTGETIQLTNLKAGDAASTQAGTRSATTTSSRSTMNAQEEWLRKDQLEFMDVIRSRKEKRENTEAYNKSLPKPKELRSIPIEEKILSNLNISPSGRFVSYSLTRPASGVKNTIVPNYVTETGFTTDIPSRSKVGATQGTAEFFIYDRDEDTVYAIKTDSLVGIRQLPEYLKDYPKQLEEKTNKAVARPVRFGALIWSPQGQAALLEVRSLDNKDRWILKWDLASKKLSVVDRQRDEAWIGGPGIESGRMGWINETTCWFQSEASGYSHLYTANIINGEKKALTKGNYEVQQAVLSADKQYFLITSNEIHPGEQHFYRLSITNGKTERLTTQTGAHQIFLSPDQRQLAILYSYSNKPWELFVMDNKPGAKMIQITDKSQTEEFKSYPWRDPELINFVASDGARVYARLYRPQNVDPDKPAVLFVHGAGYLQNAHKWWSSYFREYMFNNLLADHGYYVLDIDYRGSSGYGRHWRTGIYRHMGGKDLSDHVDAVDYLVKNHGVNPRNIGIYGGSYGGFITLMAMFNEAQKFSAGAALRPVTDWAQYNHGYTSNILNEPHTDSIAYRRSSPLYFASGLKGHLLMCHGMVDVNVHFQDAVKLSQRLIELGKDNWELAVYPMEDHAFVEPSSWTDEYKRIFKLFEQVLKPK